jgi:deferrochelatase/peroxidase EfeB
MPSRAPPAAADDYLMDYSKAVSGSNFFAPSLEMLKALGKR